MVDDCALVILSHDAYSDLWANCVELHDRFWPTCPFRRYLAAETYAPRLANCEVLLSEASGQCWSEGLGRILTKLPTPYVLLMLDDFYINTHVDSDKVIRLLEEQRRNNWGCMQLVPPPFLRHSGDEGLNEDTIVYAKGLPYRVSLQAALWNVTFLKSLLAGSESPWQFEMFGTTRAEYSDWVIRTTREALIGYVDVLRRGRWKSVGVALCEREGLQRLPGRGQEGLWQVLGGYWSRALSRTIESIPPGARIGLRRAKWAVCHRKSSQKITG